MVAKKAPSLKDLTAPVSLFNRELCRFVGFSTGIFMCGNEERMQKFGEPGCKEREFHKKRKAAFKKMRNNPEVRQRGKTVLL
jgi:hypothetical protein